MTPEGERHPARPLTRTRSPAGFARLLVVDDDSVFRARLVKALSTRGLEAHAAGSGDEALPLARSVRPQAAVVDLRMPGMSGLDLVRELTAAVPGIRIVVLTGYGSIPTAVEAVRRGAVNYLSKPVDTEQILAAFDREAGEADLAAESGATARPPAPRPSRRWRGSSGNTSSACWWTATGTFLKRRGGWGCTAGRSSGNFRKYRRWTRAGG